jgi:hypothetical protein
MNSSFHYEGLNIEDDNVLISDFLWKYRLYPNPASITFMLR